MDELIKSIKSCKLTKKEIDLLDLIEEIDQIDKPDSEMEWEKLKNNYLKLKYLDELFEDHVTFPYDGDYIKSLSIFLEQIDSLSKHYLECINWEKDTYYCAKRIQKNLSDSVKITCYPIKKLKKILAGYKMLMDAAQEYRNETVQDHGIDDDDFLETFQPLKKLKKN